MQEKEACDSVQATTSSLKEKSPHVQDSKDNVGGYSSGDPCGRGR